MASTRTSPWRTGLPGRPDLPTPPDRMPGMRGGRPLKRWRWVGAFGDELMLCAAVAHVGPLATSWWAVWDRGSRTLVERTSRRGSAVAFAGAAVRVDDGPVRIELTVEQTGGVETISPHGDQYIWTRKQGGVPVTGTVTVGDRRHEVELRGIVDESAGYHARRTGWRWSAGVGVAESGAAVAWNLVTGVHDAAEASERTVWVDGEPHHVEPVSFLESLRGVRFAGGGELSFTSEAKRAQRQNLLVFASDYEQPFGTFAGELPVAGRLRSGAGVMERHDVRW